MLVTSVDPPVVYLYEDDFIVRLAQHLWHQDLSTQSKTSHITNIQFTRTVTSEDEPDRVYSLEHIREYFRYSPSLPLSPRASLSLTQVLWQMTVVLLQQLHRAGIDVERCYDTRNLCPVPLSDTCDLRSKEYVRFLGPVLACLRAGVREESHGMLRRSATRALVRLVGSRPDARYRGQSLVARAQHDTQHEPARTAVDLQAQLVQGRSLRYAVRCSMRTDRPSRCTHSPIR